MKALRLLLNLRRFLHPRQYLHYRLHLSASWADIKGQQERGDKLRHFARFVG